ncbi:hypothetical protein ACFWZM_36800, partial [[Kitasatospora] papulosa]
MTAPSAPGGNRAPSRRALLTAAVATPAAGLAGALAADRPDPDPPADGKAPGAGPVPAVGPTETDAPD